MGEDEEMKEELIEKHKKNLESKIELDTLKTLLILKNLSSLDKKNECFYQKIYETKLSQYSVKYVGIDLKNGDLK